MGFHPLELAVLLVIGLLIFGPKGMQSMAHRAGKTMSQAKTAKDKLLAELPMEELNQVRDHISHIPLSPQQAVQILLTPEQERKQEAANTQAVTQVTTEAAPAEKQDAQKQEIPASSPAE